MSHELYVGLVSTWMGDCLRGLGKPPWYKASQPG